MMLDHDTVISIMDRMAAIEMAGSKSTYIVDGMRVPRVTEVLSSMLHNDGLMNWSNSLGWKRISYRAFMRDAADKGTMAHLAVEKYLKNGSVDIEDLHIASDAVRDTVISCMDGFVAWWKKLHAEHKSVELVFSERTLLHKYFAGTCDCVLKVDGKYWLIDFKTSKHMSYQYSLQLAAYRYLLKEVEGIDIERAMVLRLSKEDHCYFEHIIDLNNPTHVSFMDNCLETFFILVTGFKMRLSTTDQYYDVFTEEKRY